MLWTQITADTSSSDYPNPAPLFLESMEPTFNGVGDSMPPGKVYGYRTKLIHGVGVVGKVKLVPKGNTGYTGIFQGNDHGFVRLSLAASPNGNPFTPGMALKFLRDGVDSANIIAMYSVDGQPGNYDFFANSFSNHISFPKPGLASWAIGKKFSTATDFITSLGLSDAAQMGSDGNFNYAANFPWKLRFVPNPQLTNQFPTDKQSSSSTYFTEQLMTIPAGTTLYTIMATDKPTEIGG